MTVVDASVMIPAVADDGTDGTRCRQRLAGEPLDAPDLARIEVLSALRRHLLSGRLDVAGARQAVEDMLAMPMDVHPTGPLLQRAWELRDTITPYDACYVALAESLGTVLLTADRRLARARGPECRIEVI